jgi:hypothetical protein
MVQARRSWPQRLALWMAQRLLGPLRRREERLQALLLDRLDAVLGPMAGGGEAGLAVLEGALALAEADGEIRPEEWALFERGMARLDLAEPVRQQLSLHGAIDLPWVCSALEGIEDPGQRRAIGQFYGLLVAADGQGGAAELAVLRPLLRALEAAALEAELPRMAGALLRPPGPGPGPLGRARALPPMSPGAQPVAGASPCSPASV